MVSKEIGPEELTVLLVEAHKTDTRVLIIIVGLIRRVLELCQL